MSGHSKWHSIKHKKGALDAKRGKVFTRIIKEFTVAARIGGGDPDMNPRSARSSPTPSRSTCPTTTSTGRSNAARARNGRHYEEITYEGYGPGGVAVMVESMTDNRNRTVGEVRKISRSTAATWGGRQRRLDVREEGGHRRREGQGRRRALMTASLDAGADDMSAKAKPAKSPARRASRNVLEAVKKLGIEPLAAEVQMVPKKPSSSKARPPRR